jgi:hypothetical protein
VEAIRRAQHLVICSAEADLEILDAKSLLTLGTIADGTDQHIYDFAIDEQRDRAFVLSLRRDLSARLTSYSLSSGRQQQELTISRAPFTRMELALEALSGQLAVNIVRDNSLGPKSDILACNQESTITCVDVGHPYAVSQMTFLGKELLLATGRFADRRGDCIDSVAFQPPSVTQSYCAPTGVHYGVGVTANRYVVAFTGQSKYHKFSEQITSEDSSFSIWGIENRHVLALTDNVADLGFTQSAIRIVGDKDVPAFIAYNEVSNVVYVYSIQGS